MKWEKPSHPCGITTFGILGHPIVHVMPILDKGDLTSWDQTGSHETLANLSLLQNSSQTFLLFKYQT